MFGGTSIKREAGKELSIDCTLEITEGTAKVFWISGSDEAVTLIEATGTYSDTITLPVIQYNNGCSWRASFPSRKSGVFCCHFFGDGSGGKQFQEQVYAAVVKLPEKQAKRIYARYYLEMTVNEIAEVEGVDPSRVRDSIRRGLK